MGPQARIVYSLCLHSGRQLALSSLAPAVGPFSLFSGILFLSFPPSLLSYLCLPYVVMVRGRSLVRCESLAIRHRKRKSWGRFASVNWGSQTGCVRGSESARRASFVRFVSTPVDSWPCLPSLRPRGRFRFFFEPSRVSEALCRRQEPREGVPKRARACERGGEARRREPRGRRTTTYRTFDARLPSDCERLLLFTPSLSYFLSARKIIEKAFWQRNRGFCLFLSPSRPLFLHSGPVPVTLL